MCRQFGYDKTNGSQDLTSCSDKCAGLRDTSLGQTSTFLRVPRVGKQVHLDCFCRSDLLKFSEMHSKEVKRCFLNKALSCLEEDRSFFFCLLCNTATITCRFHTRTEPPEQKYKAEQK